MKEQENSRKGLYDNTVLHLFLIVLITSIVYINILPNDFVWDDKSFFVKWEEKKQLSNIPLFLQGNVPEGHEGVYRPVRSIFYAISYKIWGNSKVGNHINSILIHLCAAILMYFIVANLSNKPTALIASLLFGAHPIHTESISYATASFDVIGIIFLLLSFLFYIKYKANKKIKMYIFSIFFAALAFFTYEVTIILPLLLILYDLCFRNMKIKELGKELKFYLPFVLIAFAYLYIRFFIIEIIGRGNYLGTSFYHTMLAMSKVFLKYISLTVLPIGLAVDHTISDGIMSLTYVGYNIEKILSQSIFDFHIAFSMLVILFLLFISIKTFKNYPIITFCIGWFFISLLPVSNIIFIGSLMGEKYLYLASFGVCFLLASFIYKLKYVKFEGLKARYISVILLILILLFYSATTITRNKDWKDDLSLWSATIEKSPESPIAHYNLGNAHAKEQKWKSAVVAFKKAIQLNNNYIKAYNNLGLAYIGLGELGKAESVFKVLLTVNPDYADAYNNLGIIYAKKDNEDLAIGLFKKAIEIKPDYADAYNNLGIIYFKNESLDLAKGMFEKAVLIEPDFDSATKNLRMTNLLIKRED